MLSPEEAKRVSQERLAAVKARLAAQSVKREEIRTALAIEKLPIPEGKYSFNGITLDGDQSRFVDIALTSPKTAVLLGAAGSGKSTSQGAFIESLLKDTSGEIPRIYEKHKYLIPGTPGIVVVAFTNRAVGNIRKKLPIELQDNCLTIHKLLEYQPEFDTYLDENGNEKTVRRFVPGRDVYNKLPSSITKIIIEEAGMLGVQLYNLLISALPDPKPAMVFLGDIEQVQPIFSPSILGYKMLEAIKSGTCVNLTKIHRQALDSPIIAFAHRILRGEADKIEKTTIIGDNKEIVIQPFIKKVQGEIFINAVSKAVFEAQFKLGTYDPMEDMILIPYFKGNPGALQLSMAIANWYAKHRDVEVWEIISGFRKVYYSLGDRICYNKQYYVITKIAPNAAYTGAPYRPQSRDMDYQGNISTVSDIKSSDKKEDFDILIGEGFDSEESKQQASHIITLQSQDDPEDVIDIRTSGEINSSYLGYSDTIHKAQGSESKRVFIILHHRHHAFSRELLYTAVTRAKESLHIVCEPDSLTKAVAYQQLKGASIEEKAEIFKGKIEQGVFPDY